MLIYQLNVMLNKDEGQLHLSDTDLTMGVMLCMHANMDGKLGITLSAKTLTDVVNSLKEPEIVYSVNGKPEASLKCSSYKGVVKEGEASEFPAIPVFDFSDGLSLEVNILKEMILKTAFAASKDDSRRFRNLEAVSSKNVVIEVNAANTPAVIRASDDQDFLYRGTTYNISCHIWICDDDIVAFNLWLAIQIIQLRKRPK